MLPLGILLVSGGVGYVRGKRPPPDAGGGADLGREAGNGQGTPQKPAAFRAGGPVFEQARNFLDRLQRAKLEELPGIWDSLAEGPGRNADRQLVIARWAELDPAGALVFAKDKEDPQGLIFTIFAVWGETDPDAALAAMQVEKDPEFLAQAAAGWLQAVRDDPAALIARAGKLTWMDASEMGQTDFRRAVPEEFLQKLFAADPAGLRKLISWLPPWFGDLLDALEWKQLLRDHAEEALAAFESMPLTREKLSLMIGSLEPLAKSDPERAADLLIKLAGRPGQELLQESTWYGGGGKFLETLMTTLGPRNPERMREVLLKMGAQVTGSEVLVNSMLRDNPALALQIAPALTKADLLGDYLMTPLPVIDSTAAFAAVSGAPPSYFRDQIMERVLLEINRADPATAAALVEGFPEGEVRDSARLTLDLASASPEMRMMERAGRMARPGELSEEEKGRVLSTAIMAARGDLPEASRRISEWTTGPAQDVALDYVGSYAASNDDPQAAIRWAAALPRESQQAAAYAGIAKGWTGADPVAASEWVNSLPEGAGREAAVGSFAAALAGRDPEAGLQWAATLVSPDERLRRLQEVTDTWKSKDATAAAATIRTLPGLAETDRQSLLKSIP